MHVTRTLPAQLWRKSCSSSPGSHSILIQAFLLYLRIGLLPLLSRGAVVLLRQCRYN